MVYQLPSEINRQRLTDVCKREGITNISFYISPDRIISTDAAVAEVAYALERFYEDRRAGRLKPDNDSRL